MLWLRSHRWYRDRLSAYLDGELSGKDALRLGAHLDTCPSCTSELAELRAASALLAELPEVDVPRSFALTAAGVAGARQTQAPGLAHSANSGLRMAGAGLAAALVVVLVLDAGGILGGEEGGNDGGGSANALQRLEMTSGPEKAMQDSATGQLATATLPATPPVERSAGGVGSAGVGGPVSGSVVPSDSASTESPTPTVEPPHSRGGGGSSGGGSTQVPVFTPAPTDTPAPTPQPPDAFGLKPALALSPSPGPDAAAFDMPNVSPESDNKTVTNSSSTADSDGGPSAVLVTEIVLAALLGMSIAGIAAATYAERRRR